MTQDSGWRGTQWFMAIFGLVLFFGMLFCLPETLRTKDKPQDKRMESPELSDDELPAREDGTAESPGLRPTISRASRRTLKESRKWIKTTKIVLVDPLKSLLYLRFPPVLLTVIYTSVTFGALVPSHPPLVWFLRMSLTNRYSTC